MEKIWRKWCAILLETIGNLVTPCDALIFPFYFNLFHFLQRKSWLGREISSIYQPVGIEEGPVDGLKTPSGVVMYTYFTQRASETCRKSWLGREKPSVIDFTEAWTDANGNLYCTLCPRKLTWKGKFLDISARWHWRRPCWWTENAFRGSHGQVFYAESK